MAEGGEIDQDSVVPDPPPADLTPEIDPSTVVVDGEPGAPDSSGEIDPNTVVPDEIDQDSVIPDEDGEGEQAAIPNEGADHSTKYETPKQQAIGAVEGLAHGLTMGASSIAENKILGVPAEDIEGRAADNPWGHGAAEIAGSILGPGKVIKGAKIGSAMLKQAIGNGLIQAGDEVSRWALGQGDPNDGAGAAIARTTLALITGGIFGKLGSEGQKVADKTINSIAEEKFGEQAHYFLYGIANAMKGGGIERGLEVLSKAALNGYKAGHKFFENSTSKLLPSALGAVSEGIYGAKKGYEKDGLLGGLTGGAEGASKGALHGLIATLAGMGLKSASKYMAPTILKVLSGNSVVGNAIPGITGAVDHVANMASGLNATHRAVESVFNLGARTTQKAISSYGDPKLREKLNDYLESGDFNSELQKAPPSEDDADVPGYAHGGHVEQPSGNTGHSGGHGLATHYPEQNMIMSAAKGRMVNYLNSLRPSKIHQKLPFDDDPDTSVQKKRYDKALDVAITPLGVMEDVKDGTLEPETVAHFNALHPEVGGLLQKKITEQITRSQLKGHKPSFQVRQGLSLLMGKNLSSDFTPEIISAAQATFNTGKQNSQPGGDQAQKTKRGTAPLSKSDAAFLTDDQARERRQQKV